MKRRNFLKALGITAAAAPLIKPTLEDKENWQMVEGARFNTNEAPTPIRGVHQDQMIVEVPWEPIDMTGYIDCNYVIKKDHKILARGHKVSSIMHNEPQYISNEYGYRELVRNNPTYFLTFIVSAYSIQKLLNIFYKEDYVPLQVDMFFKGEKKEYFLCRGTGYITEMETDVNMTDAITGRVGLKMGEYELIQTRG